MTVISEALSKIVENRDNVNTAVKNTEHMLQDQFEAAREHEQSPSVPCACGSLSETWSNALAYPAYDDSPEQKIARRIVLRGGKADTESETEDGPS